MMTIYSLSYCQVIPLPGTHAHNDYNHEIPLFDALSNGFTSIEVDLLIIDGDLYVGHDLPKSNSTLPTLEEAYLKPLDSIFRLNNGKLYPGYNETCYLMLDIKSEATETYLLLYHKFQKHRSLINPPQDGSNQSLVIFLSGNRPFDSVLNDTEQLFALDGRPEDLGKGYSVKQMPVISQAFYKLSNWRGVGEMTAEDQQKIKMLAEAVHKENKKLRLWAHPDNPNAWSTLRNLGVDIINSDDLKGVRDYFLDK